MPTSWLKRLLYYGTHNSLANVKNTQLFRCSLLKVLQIFSYSVFKGCMYKCLLLFTEYIYTLVYLQVISMCSYHLKKRKYAIDVSFAHMQTYLGKKQVIALNNIVSTLIRAVFSEDPPREKRLVNNYFITHGKPSF